MKVKVYNLSTEEKDLLVNQNNLRSQYEYLASLIQRDSYIYLNREVRERLGLKQDVMLTPDLVKGTVTATKVENPKKK